MSRYAKIVYNPRTKGQKYTKKHARYNLSVAGSFGSKSLMFLSRQKRDEVRNALIQGMKQCGKTDIKFVALNSHYKQLNQYDMEKFKKLVSERNATKAKQINTSKYN